MKLSQKLLDILEDDDVIPEPRNVLRAFGYFRPQETKVIIIGTEPYNNKSDANGLCFSVEHNEFPPSLKNIFKELKNDLGYKSPKIGDLSPWAKQGVLLTNTLLTTKKNKPLAHKGRGWEDLVKKRIQKVLNNGTPVVIIAWGNPASELVDTLVIHDKCLILKGKHPSPVNTRGGFLNGHYFSRANQFLKTHGVKEIDWKL
jgi:uracil-DNA glycosylase